MPRKPSKKQKKLKGFTVTELLAIIAVVGILALIALTAYAPTRAKARDSKRITELNHLRNALQLYYMDKGHYPESNPPEEWCSLEDSCPNVLQELSSYLPATPSDPLFGRGQEPDEDILYSYQYISTSSGGGYKLHVDLEKTPPYYYELASYLGSPIAYVPGGGGTGGGGSMTCSGTPISLPNVENWHKVFNKANNDDVPEAVKIDSNNNVIVTGYVIELGQKNYYIIKYDSNGNTSWEKSYNPGCNCSVAGLAIDNQNNVIVLGSSINMSTNNDYRIIKYDPSGNELWNKDYTKAGNQSMQGITVDANNNIIVTGRDVGIDYFTVKYDSDGNELWNKNYDNTDYGFALDVISDSNNNIIVTGYASFGGIGRYDFYTIKYDPDGNQIWDKIYNNGLGRADYAHSVVTDLEDNIIIAGEKWNGSTWDVQVVKYSSSGDELWVQAHDIDQEKATVVDVDSNCNIITNGYTGPLSGPMSWLLMAYDKDGNYLWEKIVDSGNDDEGYGIILDSNNKIIITGYFYDAVTKADWHTIKY